MGVGTLSDPVIEVRDLVKRYKKADKNAVDGVSFSIRLLISSIAFAAVQF